MLGLSGTARLAMVAMRGRLGSCRAAQSKLWPTLPTLAACRPKAAILPTLMLLYTRSNHMVLHAASNADGSDENERDVNSESGGDDEFLESLAKEEDDIVAGVSSGGVGWGQKALEVAQGLLPGGGEIQLFAFRTVPATQRIDIRLDKLTDRYGSPSLDEITEFSWSFNAGLEAALGPETAGEVTVEVSSPGAERQLRIPEELSRFADLPMRVEYENGPGQTSVKILSLVRLAPEGGAAEWVLADVRANRPAGKGRPLSKKRREEVLEIAVPALRRVNLHIDV